MSPIVRRFIFLTLALALAGCGGVIPADLRDKIQSNVGLPDLQRDPEAHRGQFVLLGGEILDVKFTKSGDFVEVLQRPLYASSHPNLVGGSQGRFFVKLTKEVLLEKEYREGQPLTVVGEVTGDVQGRPGTDVPSPIVEAKYLRLWTARDYAGQPVPPFYHDDFYFRRPIFVRPRR